jgi:SAM-dependent methyltransferase
VREVVAYNWPMYATGALATATGLAAARRLPRALALPARLTALATATLMAASTAATWYVYDHSSLYRLDWLDSLLPHGPGEHLVVSCGLDEVSPLLTARHPGARQSIADLFDPILMTEGSIRRARHRHPPAPGSIPARPGALPAENASQDTVFAVFAAHELRMPGERAALFAEIHRVLRPGGTLVLVEHTRNPANIAAFGPGAWHFMTRRVWLHHAAETKLRRVGERRIAGLVTAFAFRKEPNAAEERLPHPRTHPAATSRPSSTDGRGA